MHKGLILACDCGVEEFYRIVRETKDFDIIKGYKVGARLALEGMDVIEVPKMLTKKEFIYDHQKWGNDTPHTANDFAEVLKRLGYDAVIIHSFSGPDTRKACIEAAFENGLEPIVGAMMSHKGFLRSEGGFLTESDCTNIYLDSYDDGVRNFVMPATRLGYLEGVLPVLRDEEDVIIYGVGFGKQGGNLLEFHEAVKYDWRAIIGRSIIGRNDVKDALMALDELL